MSSEEDVPAPSPSAAVVARRAGREAKSMREESGSGFSQYFNNEISGFKGPKYSMYMLHMPLLR